MPKIIFRLMLSGLSVHICICSITKSGLFQRESNATLCGTIISLPSVQKWLSCSSECLTGTHHCSGILISGKRGSSQECKLISPEVSTPVDSNALHEYEHFAIKSVPQVACDNMGISTPVGWRSGCPVVYFSMDVQITGGLVNADFLSAGKLDQALNVPTVASASDGYYNLGNFPQTDYCFPDPATCPNGVTYAFWMKIASLSTNIDGYLTTALDGGPGFRVYSKPGGVYFLIRRFAENKQTFVYVDGLTFNVEYGFDNWIHYTIAYR